MDKPFAITGATLVVAATAVNIGGQQTGGGNSFRVRNLSTSTQYFTGGQSNAVTSLTPVAGTPSPFTIGMLGSSVETFSNLPGWMIASSATGFEVTPGDGV